MIHLATFNIFWYPSSDVAQNQRTESDDLLLVRVLTSLDAHALVFQEILDLRRLEALLATVAGHDYRLRLNPGGEWLSNKNTDSTADMKIACAYDAAVFELVAGGAIRNPDPYPGYPRRRDPYALHLRHRLTGVELTLVGVHLKSDSPSSIVKNESDPEGKDLREREAAFLAAWLSGKAEVAEGHFKKPPTENVVVMGDFNAVLELPALAPLRQETLQDWHWPDRTIVSAPSTQQPVADPWGEWSTFWDGVKIDHALVSPNLKNKIQSAVIYAFDLDPALDEAPPAATHWLRRKTDYELVPMRFRPLQLVENLYRISDHRPVWISIATA